MPAPERHRPPRRRLSDAEADALAEAMAAFATPSRLKLLFGLLEEERTVEELADETDLNPNLVSQQLRVLRFLRLVTGRRDGRHVRYLLYDSHVAELLEAIRRHGEHLGGKGSRARVARTPRTTR